MLILFLTMSPLSAICFFLCLKQEYIPDLYNHFLNVGLEAHMYASQWFLTLFTAKFPLYMVFHIIDLLLCEVGNKRLTCNSHSHLRTNLISHFRDFSSFICAIFIHTISHTDVDIFGHVNKDVIKYRSTQRNSLLWQSKLRSHACKWNIK